LRTRGSTSWRLDYNAAEMACSTVSENTKLLASALIDQERKHRKRSPDEMSRIQSERVGSRR
jgi:hypothetical protein